MTISDICDTTSVYLPFFSDIMSDEVLANVARPNTSATLTIRVIKSFKFRTERSLVIHDVNLVTMTVVQLKDIAKQSMFDSIQSSES